MTESARKNLPFLNVQLSVFTESLVSLAQVSRNRVSKGLPSCFDWLPRVMTGVPGRSRTIKISAVGADGPVEAMATNVNLTVQSHRVSAGAGTTNFLDPGMASDVPELSTICQMRDFW